MCLGAGPVGLGAGPVGLGAGPDLKTISRREGSGRLYNILLVSGAKQIGISHLLGYIKRSENMRKSEGLTCLYTRQNAALKCDGITH